MKLNPEKIIVSIGILLIALVVAYVIYMIIWWWSFDSNA